MGSDKVPVAVLGDSDSHSYGDGILLADPALRGGPYRTTTLQWTEVWDRLRHDEVDLGSWGVWGTRGRIAWLRRTLGLSGRAPRKEDFRHNFAISGARCRALHEGMARQVDPLLDLVERDPAGWAEGVVVIRIGVNSFGQPRHLDRLARGEALPEVEDCARSVLRAAAKILAASPGIRVILVGIFNNAHWAKVTDRWQNPAALRNIENGLRPFDDALRSMTALEPRAVFHDDQAWMARLWGGRDEEGRPSYSVVELPGGVAVTNSVGDAPTNAVVADGHFGTVANGLWLQSLVALAREAFSVDWTPITDEEILALLPAAEVGTERSR